MKLTNAEKAIIAQEKLVYYLLNLGHRRVAARRSYYWQWEITQNRGSSWRQTFALCIYRRMSADRKSPTTVRPIASSRH